jgi:hypothetical protein
VERAENACGWYTHGECFNAATEGNSVERSMAVVCNCHCQPQLQCGHGGELRGKSRSGRSSWYAAADWQASMRPRRGTPWKVFFSRRYLLVSSWLQCGHGGELRGKGNSIIQVANSRRTIAAASMRPRRGTPWKDGLARCWPLGEDSAMASMRPRRGTPWKGSWPRRQDCLDARICFNAATEGNSVESKPHPGCLGERFGFNAATEGNSVESRSSPAGVGSPGDLRGRSFNAATEGNSVESQPFSVTYHQPPRLASMRPRRGTPWKSDYSVVTGTQNDLCFNAATEGNSVEGVSQRLELLRGLVDSDGCGFNAATEGNSVERLKQQLDELRAKLDASMRPRRGTPWKGQCITVDAPDGLYGFNAATEGNSVERLARWMRTPAWRSALQCGHGGELRGRMRFVYVNAIGSSCFNAATEGNSVERIPESSDGCC